MKETIDKLKRYFDVKELVCEHVYSRFKEDSWYFIDEDILKVLLWLRTAINEPILINNWASGGTLSQRGLRCNMCEIVKSKKNAYLSAHVLGKAIDLNVDGQTAEETRTWIKEHKNELPINIRLEKGVNWVHIDTRNYTDEKMLYF